MIRTALTTLLDLRTPVIGAPMAGVAGGELARAVSSAGGLGMIGVGADSPAFVAEQCAIPRAAGLPFGVGLMTWVLADRRDLLDAVIKAAPRLVSVSFGDPAPFVGPLREAGILVATSVNTRGDLDRALAADVDVVVAQGTEAGGHTGRRATLPLLQEVLEATDRPVVAAGGIATGRGMAAALAAGAAGVWIGTPLLACPEGLNAPAFRARVCAADGEQTVLTSVFDIALELAWPERWAGRALANSFTEQWHGQEQELRGDPAASERVREARRTADPEAAPVYAGESVGLVTRERPAAEVVRDLDAGAHQALRAAAGLLT